MRDTNSFSFATALSAGSLSADPSVTPTVIGPVVVFTVTGYSAEFNTALTKRDVRFEDENYYNLDRTKEF